MTTMKAIETQYRGYRFRSRLEARWAVFFDALRVAWEYEPEGFELGFGERYLPDFRVTYADCVWWFEVKPSISLLTASDYRKLQSFVAGGNKLMLLDGTPEAKMYCEINQHESQNLLSASAARHGWALMSDKRRPWWDDYENYFTPTTHFGRSTAIEDAVTAARGARFEFGEKG